jgi:DNA-directed RNA polymerase subunit RPC12/RpoP
MVKFRCNNCGYSFAPKSAEGSMPKICPYCSRQRTLAPEKTANELLNEFTGFE